MIKNYSKRITSLFIAAKLTQMIPSKLYQSVIFLFQFCMISCQGRVFGSVFAVYVKVGNMILMLRQVIHLTIFP